jgi:tetratricopeptide (TPR) repeat protein
MKTAVTITLISCLLTAARVYGVEQPVADEEVLKPALFSEQETRFIRSLPSLGTERLVELLQVYERLGNEPMLQMIVQQLKAISPDHPEVLRIASVLTPEEEIRSTDYLEKLAARFQAGEKITDTDGIALQATALLEEGRGEEAVTLLEKLQKSAHESEGFTFIDDLAVAYRQTGRLRESAKAWQAVLDHPRSNAASRTDAIIGLAEIELELRIVSLRERAKSNPSKGLSLSANLLEENPREPLAIAFRIECLQLARQTEKLLSYLNQLKSQSRGKSFLYQNDLGDAWFLSKDYVRARAAFQVTLEDVFATPENKTEARLMLTAVAINEQVDQGLQALQQEDTILAQTILSTLERQFPTSEEVFGYRCLVYAKTGRSAEALAMLLARRAKSESEKKLFLHLDTLGDVYLERKEYDLAQASYQKLLETPGYDEENRADGRQGLIDVRRDRLLDRAYAALTAGRRKEAQACLAELQSFLKKEPELQLLQADIKLAYNQDQEAYDELVALQSRFYAGRSFPGQGSLATALQRLGRFDEAVAALDEIVSATVYTPEERWSAPWDRRSLLPNIKPYANAGLQHQDETEGTATVLNASYATSWLHDWRLLATAEESLIQLDAEQSFLNDNEASIFESTAALQRKLPYGLTGEIMVGGAKSGILYGAKIGRLDHPVLAWSLGFKGNARATDSLPLQVLNGRENIVEFTMIGTWNSRVRYGIDAYAKRVHVDGDNLGEGYGVTANLDYIVQQETIRKPEIAVGYAGEYTRFNSVSSLPASVNRELADSEQVRRALSSDDELRRAVPANYGREIFDNLVDPETHRHGVQVSMSKRLGTDWKLSAEAGTYYELSQESLEFSLAAGVEYWLSDSAMLYAELRYDTSGRAASAGEAVIEASLGAEVSF